MKASGNQLIDIIVCHYNPFNFMHLRYMVLYAMAYICKDDHEKLKILVVDGSPLQDNILAGSLETLGVDYLHCGRELSFGETFNMGIRKTSRDVVIIMANDIFIEARQLYQLAEEIQGNVGCAMPYLSFSDLEIQKTRKYPVPRRCFPSQMTLNVNAFSRKALEEVGLIPEEMTGCFNDVILYIRLREAKYSIVLRNVGQVIHLGKQTLKSCTSVSYQKDTALFRKLYPHYWDNDNVLFHKVAQHSASRSIYRLMEFLKLSPGVKQVLWNWVFAIEPYICSEPGTFKEAADRFFKKSTGAKG